MKKIIATVLVLTLSLSLVGCGGNTSNDSKTAEKATSAPTQAPTPEPTVDPAMDLNVPIQFKNENGEVAYSHYKILTNEIKEKFLVVYFNFTNLAEEEACFSNFFIVNCVDVTDAKQDEKLHESYEVTGQLEKIDHFVDARRQDIDSGETITIAQCFKLCDETSYLDFALYAYDDPTEDLDAARKILDLGYHMRISFK